ncbi:SDR family NAD(P)-dependent oxidoreductase [Sinomonas gamaensis]|uniref:SDR family NAD(P)-dependent oxidoreductase n=1 Tax=Sinomonas gamaensis TaxID=2565624 RepID=UPI001108F65A|nr:SDR family oxidoreductase [Sinomonas gamaensis]
MSGTVIVTGAASGMGRAIAERLKDAGHAVAGLDLQVAETAYSAIVDVSDAVSVRQAVAEAESELGPLAGAVSAAGHYQEIPFGEIDDATWRRMLKVHLGGFRNVAAAVLPKLIEQRQGSIVVISSELAIGGGGGDAHYAAAKGAQLGLMRSLAAEYAHTGVRVNAIAPGPTDTPLLAADSRWREPAYLATLPSGRLATATEVARCAEFLIDGPEFVCGEVLNLNSGAVI